MYTKKKILKWLVQEKVTSCIFRNGTIRFGNEKFSFTIRFVSDGNEPSLFGSEKYFITKLSLLNKDYIHIIYLVNRESRGQAFSSYKYFLICPSNYLNFTFIIKKHTCIQVTYIPNFQRKHSRSKEKKTSNNSNTNYHREMKFVPFCMDYCLLQFDALKFFLGIRLHRKSLPNFIFFSVNPQIL